MSSTKSALGRMVWRENMTPDLAKAKVFYGELFNWTFENFEVSGERAYPMIMANGKTIGGLMQLTPEMGPTPPYWTSYVEVASADATCAAAKEHGGAVLWGPADVPTVGRMAMIADGEGAAISILQPASGGMGDGVGVRPGVGEFCWETLSVANPQQARAFWTAVLPWKVGSGGGMDTFGVGDGMENQVADLQSLQAPGVPPNWLTYVVVAKLEDATARAASLGGAVMVPPFAIPGIGRIAVINDNQGAVLGLFEPDGI